MKLPADSSSTLAPALQNRLAEISETIGHQFSEPPASLARRKLAVRFINDIFPVSIYIKEQDGRPIAAESLVVA